MRPREILEKRGIAKVADLMGWQEATSTHWHYPVYAPDGKTITTRAKAYDSKAKPKYYWPDGKPENPDADYYTPPGAKEAIAAADGAAYLANGEASVLAYNAAGIKNVFATTHGEGTIPKTLIDYCQRLGVRKLINIADKDNAGVKAAAKWRDALRDSGIEYQAKQWPAYLPEKSDFNDLWMHVSFDQNKAREALASCEALILPQPETKAPRPTVQLDYSEGRAKLVTALHEELNRRGNLGRRLFQNIWQQCHCPFHDDKNASAGFNIESGVLNCMGECGKSFSPKELAERFGMEWQSYVPRTEGKKKPKKAEIQAFQEALDTTPQESRPYEEILLEEMNLRLMMFWHAQQGMAGYQAFGQWNAMPLGVLSAVMTLCNGRSSTALFLGRLFGALLAGKLPTIFTREMLADALGLSYNAVSRGLFEAEHLSFLRKLSGLLFNIDSSASKETVKNPEGRPCDWFMVELERDVITTRLRSMMEIYQLEKACKKAVAIPSNYLAMQIGLNQAEYRTWLEKARLGLEDPMNKAAKQAYDLEMLGDGNSWKGWIKALENPYSIPLDYCVCETSLDLRAALLSYWVRHLKRSVNTREELARLLGCTDPVIDKVMDKADLKSIPQTLKVELNFSSKEAKLTWEDALKNEFTETEKFQKPTTVKGMEALLNHFQSERRGKIWKVSFLVTGEEGWQVSDWAHFKRDFARYNGRINRVFFLMNTPSRQVPMSDFDIAEREEKRQQEASETPAQTPAATPKTEAAKAAPVANKAPKEAYVYTKWDKHSYGFSYIQLKNFVHGYTLHSLEGMAIVDKKGKQLVTGELKSLWQWVIENAAPKPVRRMKSLFSSDEDDNMQELEALAAAQLKRHEWQEIVEFEDDVDNLPIFADMPQQTALAFVPTATPVMPAKVIPAPECDDVNSYKREKVNIVANPNMTLEYVMGLGRRDKKEQGNRFEKAGR